jgi:hypothetical protein
MKKEYPGFNFDEKVGFVFSERHSFTLKEIEESVMLLRISHLIPPPFCLVLLLEEHMPMKYMNTCRNANRGNLPKDIPLKLRSGQEKMVLAINEFIHDGGEKWLEENKC